MPDVASEMANGQAEEPRHVRIGVLALQGSFREHIASLRRLPNVEAVEVRTKEQLRSVDGLVIPGALLDAANMIVFLCRHARGSCRQPHAPTCHHDSLVNQLDGRPGGESTTMANIAERWGLIPDLRSYCEASRPVWGTCAGLIFLAERATGEAHL